MLTSRKIKGFLGALVIAAMVLTSCIPATVQADTGGEEQGTIKAQAMDDFGVSGPNSVTKMLEDGNGNLFVLGNARTQVGASDTGTSQRIFVKKFAKNDLKNAAATAVLTGSSSSESYYSADINITYDGAMAIDGSGNVYVAGTYKNGTGKSIIVVKYNNNLEKQGQFTVASSSNTSSGTYYDPQVFGMAVDASGSIYVSGHCAGELNFTSPRYDFATFGSTGSKKTGWIAKINSDMNKVDASTYMGGQDAQAMDLAIDGNDLYVLGTDSSGKIPTTAGVLQENMSESRDAYIAKMSTSDLSVSAATYYGGNGNEEASAIRIVGDDIYVLGDTTSSDLKMSEDAPQTVYSGGWYPDVYVMKISRTLRETDDFAATYWGKSGRVDAMEMAVDSSGKVYITGNTSTASAAVTTDESANGRIFLASFNADLSSLLAATTLGNDGSGDSGNGLVADGSNVYLAGTRGSGASSAQMFLAKYTNTFAHAKITNVKTDPAGYSSRRYYYGSGQTIKIDLVFDAAVKVTGTPTLKLNIDNNGKKQEAVYKEGSGTKTLVFEYTVVDGDTTGGQVLEVADANSLQLNGGTIEPAAGAAPEDTDLTLPTTKLGACYSYVNTVPATVKSVSTSLADGTYGPGTVIPITVEFSDVLTEVTGTPELKLNTGGKAVFKEIVTTGSGSYAKNTEKLKFEYTVGANDAASKLDFLDSASLVLPSGASIKDQYGLNVKTELPAAGGTGSIAEKSNIVIDKDAVTVTKIEIPADYQNKSYNAGKEIPIEVTFSAPVTTTGQMKLALNSTTDYTTAAVAEPVTDQTKVTMKYTVATGDTTGTDGYLDYPENTSLTMASGADISANGKAVSLYLKDSGSDASLAPARVVIDTTAPKNSTSPYLYNSKESFSSTKYFGKGSTMYLKIGTSEDVVVKDGAKPYITMNYKPEGAAENARWVYDSVGTNCIWFKYDVQDTDSLSKGDLYDAGTYKLVCEDGDITDAAGNSMNTTLMTPSSWSSGLKYVYIDTAAPVFEADSITA